MRVALLLDTHTLLWALTDPIISIAGTNRVTIPATIRRMVRPPDNQSVCLTFTITLL